MLSIRKIGWTFHAFSISVIPLIFATAGFFQSEILFKGLSAYCKRYSVNFCTLALRLFPPIVLYWLTPSSKHASIIMNKWWNFNSCWNNRKNADITYKQRAKRAWDEKMKNSKNYGFLSVSMIGILLIVGASTLLHGYFYFGVSCIGFLLFTYGICKDIKKRMDTYKETKK